MTSVSHLESELKKRFKERLQEIDERAAETMSGGLLRGYDEYKFSAGYRKAIRDAGQVIDEVFEDLMKE